MLDDLARLEQRARHLYAPTMVTRSASGQNIVQCELQPDELAELRAVMRRRLAVVAVPAVDALALLSALAVVACRHAARWLRQWKRTPQIG
jgi:hypothetical protein